MRTLLTVVLLTACSATVTPDARYIGSITPTAASSVCKTGRAVLRLRNGEAVFSPDETTWTLTGTAAPTGALQAERTGRGANKQPYLTQLNGTWTAEAVSGTYKTPRCAYTVQLTRR